MVLVRILRHTPGYAFGSVVNITPRRARALVEEGAAEYMRAPSPERTELDGKETGVSRPPRGRR